MCTVLYLIVSYVLASYAVERFVVLSLFGYLVPFQAALAVLGSAMSTYINVRSPEEQRATVLSFQTGLFSAAMIVLFPLFGLGIAHVSYTTVYLWTLIVLSGGSGAIGVMVWWLLRTRRLNRARRSS